MRCKEKRKQRNDEQKIEMQEKLLCKSVNQVWGPLLYFFVLWVLNEAVKSGKERLYFLARDGYFMYRTAEILCEQQKIPLDCRYVSCSRYSLRIPMFHLNEREALDYICRRGTAVTPEKICRRAGLSEEEKLEVLEELELEWNEGEIIPNQKLEGIRKKLERSPRFMKYMKFRSREALPGTLSYLEQEGFFDGKKDAIVDSGWVGSVQKTLQQLTALKGRAEKLEGYYFGLYEVPDRELRSLYHCYYFEPEGHLSRKVHFNQNVFEVIFSAPHGMTLGYRKAGEKYVPYYGNSENERQRFYQKLEEKLMSEIKLSVKRGRTERKKVVEKRLRKLMCHPGRGEAELLGSLPFSDEAAEENEGQLAPRLNGKQLREEHFFFKLLKAAGIKKHRWRENAWYEGSVVRTGRAVHYHLMQYEIYKYIRHMRKIRRNRRMT